MRQTSNKRKAATPNVKPGNAKARAKTPSRNAKSRLKILFRPLSDSNRRARLVFILGLILFFVCIYCLIAVASFFLCRGADQAMVKDAPWVDVLFGRVEVANVCGTQGAFLSDWLINDLFGLGSLMLIFYAVSLSLKMLRIMKRVHPVRRLVFSGAVCIWLSILLGWITNLTADNSYIFWGGIHGDTWAHWLNKSIGRVGLVLMELVVGIIIVIFVMKANPHLIQWKRIRKSEPDASTDRSSTSQQESVYDELEKDRESARQSESPAEGADLLREIRQKETVPSDSISEKNLVIDNIMEVEVAKGDELVTEATNRAITQESRTMMRHSLPSFRLPSLDLLSQYEEGAPQQDPEEIEANKQRIIATLESFKMRVTPTKATVGPTVTLYEVVPDPGIKITRIRALEDDIAMSLKSEGIRIIAPMPGKGTIGIEVPNKMPQTVSMHSVLASKRFQDSRTRMELPVVIGKTITNEAYMFDLTKMPHLLIAGATGQGKSVGLNALITSLLYSKRPEELKFVLVDPKMLEFSLYESIDRHYLAGLPEEYHAIVTDMTKVVPTLKSLCVLMDNRYRLLTDARVRNIKEYNELVVQGKLSPVSGHEYMPYIVLIVDEFADLMMTSGKEVENPITRIAQKARAAGIHMVIATQRPSTDIITGIIKANFPARIAFKVFSMVDSRTILDTPGANQLVGRGDMLFNQGKEMVRLQCAFIDTPECEKIVQFIACQESPAHRFTLPDPPGEGEESGGKTLDAGSKDPLFDEVARMVVSTRQGSTSNIQRRFNIGYNRAGRLMDQLEAAGIVSAQDGSKPRTVMIQDENTLEQLLANFH